MVLAEASTDSTSAVVDVVQSVGPAMLALGGVWLGSFFARGREDRAWRRNQIVEACGDYLKAAAAVAQWASSEQFAARLGEGQFPTDYKNGLESLESATTLLSITVDDGIVKASETASDAVREWVNASARYQANRLGSASRAGADTSKGASSQRNVEAGRQAWLDAREKFVAATKSSLRSLR